MPTGLTGAIYEGKDVSLREYALTCFRLIGGGYQASFGGERELPLYDPPTIPIDDYHTKRLKEAKKDMVYWLSVEGNAEKLDELYNEYLETRIRENNEYLKKNEDLKSRYTKMLTKVNAWNVSEDYKSLKEFMIEQLNTSIDHDCSTYLPFEGEPESKENFIKNKILYAANDIKYHSDELDKEIKLNKELNDYVKGLYDELDKIEETDNNKKD